MKKRLILLALVLVCALALSACGCKHETWIDADCVTPKTCQECGETEGAPLGHSWIAATCETAKTCEVCGEVEGEALGHSWNDATCEAPKTCSTCALTEGEALGHIWLDATTEAPKTCETCAATEGERIITDERFTTAATADLQGTWVCSVVMTGDMIGEPNFTGEIPVYTTMGLGNDGTMTLAFAFADEEQFISDMTAYLAEVLYAELAASGYDKTGADAAMLQAYGMDVETYSAYAMEQMDLSTLFADANVTGVYYVSDGKLYSGENWNSALEGLGFTLDGDTLTLEEDITGTGAENTVFTRVTE